MENNRRKSKAGLFVLFLLLIAGVAAVSVILFFNVETIVLYNGSEYSDSEILDVAAIRVTGADGSSGENIFKVDTDAIKSRIEKQLPYIKEAKIKRSTPSKLTITLIADEPFIAVDTGSAYVILDDRMKVLELNASEVPHNAVLAEGLELESYASGETAKISESGKFDEVTTVLNAALITDLKGNIVRLNIEDEFKIVLKYNERFDIILGSSSDITRKTEAVCEIINRLNEYESGYINVSGSSMFFKPYSDEEIDEIGEAYDEIIDEIDNIDESGELSLR